MRLADISLEFNVNKTNLNKRGEGPIQVRIYLRNNPGKNQDRKLISTGIRVKPTEWDDSKQIIKGRSDKDMLNVRLRDFLRRYIDRQDYLYKKNRTISIESISDWDNPEMHRLDSFTKFCKDEIEARADIEDVTKKHHRTYLNRLNEFKTEVYFSDLHYEFLQDYERFLIKYRYTVGDEKKKLDLTRIHKYLKFIRTYINIAVKKDLFEDHQSPFKKFDTSKYSRAERQVVKKRVDLSINEIRKIERLELKGDLVNLNYIRDFFLFQCYTGLAYADMIRLKNSSTNHEVTLQGKGYVIELSRRKTGEAIYLPIYLLGKTPNDILKRRLRAKGRFLFDQYTNQYINRELKRIARMAGINKRVTSHIGRHSCAMLLLHYKVPDQAIKMVLAHANLSTTQLYTRPGKDYLRESLADAKLA